MILKKVLKNKPLQNFVFISLYQGVNFLPLVIFIPFLTKTVGVDKFGLLMLMQTICSFFYVLSDYSFSVTTVRKLSIHRENIPMVATIIKNTLGLKLLLLAISFPLFWIAAVFFLKSQFEIFFVLMGYTVVIGQATFPTWLCQGLEKNKMLFITNLISKILLCFLVFYFIKTDNYTFYLLFVGITTFLTGLLLMFYIITKDLKLSINYTFSIKEILDELKEGKDVFFSNFSISIYLSTNILLLSIFVSPYLIGLYGIADRLMMLVRTIIGIFVQAIYPNVCKLANQMSFANTIKYALKITIPFNVVIFIMCLTIWYFSPQISSFFIKKNINQLALIIESISFLPFLVSLNTVPNVVLFAYNKEKIKLYILLSSVGISLILSLLIVPHFQIKGTIYISFAVESFVALSSIYYLFLLKKSK